MMIDRRTLIIELSGQAKNVRKSVEHNQNLVALVLETIEAFD